MTDGLIAQANAWIADDPNQTTRAELEGLVAARDFPEVARRFDGLLRFGTAGLRGLLGAGPARINHAVVARYTAGLCAHLQAKALASDVTTPSICIGFDGRHCSREFANEATEICLGAGFRVFAFAHVIPTPLLAYAVTLKGAQAGIMITASHNPPDYNGYKVFAANGAQMIAPDDLAVEREALAVARVRDLPRGSVLDALKHGTVCVIDDEVSDSYHARLAAAVTALTAERAPIRIAYTALHGVGTASTRRALAEGGFRDVVNVQEQAAPDSAFPTVALPNPEEPTAMERVLALADNVNADLALANDPDADRLAVAARDRTGDLLSLSGNEVGLLLADFLLRHTPNPRQCCVLTSIVTTPLVARIVAAHGAHWEATLTGTKWICNRALELQAARGLTCILGFEEAIGYCIGDLVHDKDGVSAAAYVATMAGAAKARGLTLHDDLERLYRQHGYALSRQRSKTLSVEGAIEARTKLRALVTHPPRSLGGHDVIRLVDLEAGFTLPPTPGVILELAGDQRVCIRPSGTEPKLKFYLDARVTLDDTELAAAARTRATRILNDLERAIEELF